jgi:UDP-3-O-acyl-N-acetylglucosamine deacetylase
MLVGMRSLRGVGLFGGKAGVVSLERAPALSVRVQGGEACKVSPALAHAARADATLTRTWAGEVPASAIRNTTLLLPGRDEAGGRRVLATCEHVLSALAGLGLWNACVVLSEGSEVPIADGSALAFVELARASGLLAGADGASRASVPNPLIGASIEPIVVNDEVRVHDQHASIVVRPLRAGETPSMRYDLDYGSAAPWLVGSATWQGGAAEYVREIAPARTFSLQSEALRARGAGLFAHLSPKDMLVLDDEGVPIDNELRFANEPARHKLLDLIGDLALLGRPIAGHVHAVRSGHALAAECALRLARQAGLEV